MSTFDKIFIHSQIKIYKTVRREQTSNSRNITGCFFYCCRNLRWSETNLINMNIYIDAPREFSLIHTVRSHGWYDLAPFDFDETQATLTHVTIIDDAAVTYSVCSRSHQLNIEATGGIVSDQVSGAVKRILRLDEDLFEFYTLTSGQPGLDWVSQKRAGRLLRSPTVWEDLVKTICTTNCSWSLTKKMVANLVEKLGSVSADGRRAFPSAIAMAAAGPDFYREEIKAGYRSPYLAELSELVASGKLDPETWLTWPGTTADLKKEMKKVKGVGDYAAENLLKLLGRYDGLALDSWLRSGFYKRHNNEQACPDKTIESHYERFGKWRGLAIWCDLTEYWFE